MGLAEGEEGFDVGTPLAIDGFMDVFVVGPSLGALEGCAVGWAVRVGSAVIVGAGDVVGLPDGVDVGGLDAIGVG